MKNNAPVGDEDSESFLSDFKAEVDVFAPVLEALVHSSNAKESLSTYSQACSCNRGELGISLSRITRSFVTKGSVSIEEETCMIDFSRLGIQLNVACYSRFSFGNRY